MELEKEGGEDDLDEGEREREGERGTSAKPHEVEWVMNTRKLLVPQKIHFHLYILLDRGGREGGDRGETGLREKRKPGSVGKK